MAAMTELFWRPLPDVRVQERSRFLFFAGLATLISLAQTLGQTGAEALFMADFGAEYLPLAFIGGSLATVAGSILYAARVGEARNDTLFIQMLLAASAVLIAATALLVEGSTWIPTFLLCFFFVTQAIFVSHLWTFTADYFDAVASKRLIPLFTIGASVGGVLGGAIAVGSSQLLGSVSLIGGWGLCLLAAALLLRVGRLNLRGWGPIEIEEADETSVEGIQGAIRYMRASPLGLALFVSAIGMILALVVARYMWLDAFAREYPDPDELAVFIGQFLTATNLIEIAIEVTIVPWLIRTLGVPSTNMIHPILTMFTFGGLAISNNVYTGALARMNGEMLENSLANPIRALLCNAIPLRFRGRVRAFLEGIVVYAAMSIGGGVLWALGTPDPFSLALAGMGASSIYLASNWLVRRQYLQTLVEQLKTGRLDLNHLGDQIGDFEANRLADLWEQLLHAEGERPSASLLKMIPSLASRGILEPLNRAAVHANPTVRRACVTALASTGDAEAQRTIAAALDDADAEVRLTAARSLRLVHSDAVPADLEKRLMADPSPQIRAEAAARAGPAGLEMLEKMIAAPETNVSVAGLSAAPESLLGAANARLHDPIPEVRAAALEFVARCPNSEPTFEQACDALAHDDQSVRRAAVLLLANIDSDEALDALASALGDASSLVQFAAESVLGGLGDEGIDVVESRLTDDNERTVESALRVIARAGGENSRKMLLLELRKRVHELWYWLIALQHIDGIGSLPQRFLSAAFGDGIARNRRICFRILELVESPAIVQNVEKALRFGSPRARGDALEVLSHLGDREVAQYLVTLHESGPISERMEAASKAVDVPEDTRQLVAAASGSHARWVRLGAIAMQVGRDAAIPEEEETMERLLALKQISLFNRLSLDQLEAVHQITTEEEFVDGEVIMRQGEQGDRLYLLLEGQVKVFLHYGEATEQERDPMNAVTYMGEMAVLGGGTRTATIVSSGWTRFLSLDGNSLRELVMQMPDISFEIFHVLANRVKLAEDRLSSNR
jgi:HEAT repeat protein